jgi:hypothetical protein
MQVPGGLLIAAVAREPRLQLVVTLDVRGDVQPGGGPSSDARRSPYSDLPERKPPVTNVNMQPSYRIRRRRAPGAESDTRAHGQRPVDGALAGVAPGRAQARQRDLQRVLPRSARKRLRGDQVPR